MVGIYQEVLDRIITSSRFIILFLDLSFYDSEIECSFLGISRDFSVVDSHIYSSGPVSPDPHCFCFSA